MRYHGKRAGGPPADACGDTHDDNEPWAFGDTAFNAIKPMLALRETLRTYVMAANAATAAEGLPMLRPLAFDFPADADAAAPFAEGAFLFGDALLAQPVAEYGARTATVYLPRLPAGGNWSYFFNRTRIWLGGANVTIDAPLDEFPLFVRSGRGL
jgi:alpha-D-xyloside xylohydrolase